MDQVQAAPKVDHIAELEERALSDPKNANDIIDVGLPNPAPHPISSHVGLVAWGLSLQLPKVVETLLRADAAGLDLPLPPPVAWYQHASSRWLMGSDSMRDQTVVPCLHRVCVRV